MSRRLKISIIIIAALILVGYLTYTAYYYREGEGRTVRVGLLPIEDALPFYIAEEEELFKAEGLTVVLKQFSSAKERDAAFQAGELDVIVTDPITSIIQVDKGLKLKIIALLLGEYPEDGVFYLLAPPNTNYDINSISEVAVSTNTIIEFVTDQLLKFKGLNPEDIVKKDVPKIPVRYQLLIEGKVEAATLPDPWGSLALKNGARLLASDLEVEKPITISVLVARGDWLKDPKNREAVGKLVKALNKALEKYKENPEAYRSLVEEKLWIPEELKGEYLVKWRGEITSYPRENFELVESWLLSKGLISKTIEYTDVVENVVEK